VYLNFVPPPTFFKLVRYLHFIIHPCRIIQAFQSILILDSIDWLIQCLLNSIQEDEVTELDLHLVLLDYRFQKFYQGID